jgi:diadenosine tetraphosphatase ApaH/serine/threonine PP2A family protein phosphatase
MNLALLSDIHGNWDALKAVLEDIDSIGADHILSVGDNIGYGAEPDRVIRSLMERDIASVLGNHEQAILEPQRLSWFNPLARESLVITAGMLSTAALDYMAKLPAWRTESGCRLVHGFPPDAITTYCFEVAPDEQQRIIRSLDERRCFIGHTHDLLLLSSDAAGLTEEPLTQGRLRLLPGCRYLVNIGSVGQPRDGDKRAKYVLWNPVEDSLEVRFVPYDSEAAAAKIIAAGMPRIHAERLL